MNLISNDVQITLKEITDMLNIEHNKAVKKVEKLAEEPEFGTVARIASVYNDKGQTVETFLLTKKQAIAVAAKLDNSMLMKVINRVEELEKANSNTLLAKLNEQMQYLDAMRDVQEVAIEVVNDHEKRINVIESTRRLEAWQERSLQDAKNKKVYEYANDDKKVASVFHRKVWQLFKKKFYLPRYNELQIGQYEQGLAYIRSLTLADLVA